MTQTGHLIRLAIICAAIVGVALAASNSDKARYGHPCELKATQRLYGVSVALRASKEQEEVIVRHMTNIIERARAEAGL